MIAWTADAMRLHLQGPHHPERPERLDAALRGIEGLATIRPAPHAVIDDLLAVHDGDYVQTVLSLRGRDAQLDADTALGPGSVDAAELAVGATTAMVDALIAGETEVGWALVRPPGHHAEFARAMGFCVFNNVAIAAERAIRVHGVERVAIVDWDLHHGNGTQHLFEERDDVLFYSSHQYGGGFYPGTGGLTETGAGRGEGLTVNAPLWAGSGDGDIEDALLGRFAPVVRDFRPDLVLISAGFDAHVDDPLGGLRVSEEGFRTLALRVRDLADRAGCDRIGLVLEGGYDLGAIERSVRTVAAALRQADDQEV